MNLYHHTLFRQMRVCVCTHTAWTCLRCMLGNQASLLFPHFGRATRSTNWALQKHQTDQMTVYTEPVKGCGDEEKRFWLVIIIFQYFRICIHLQKHCISHWNLRSALSTLTKNLFTCKTFPEALYEVSLRKSSRLQTKHLCFLGKIFTFPQKKVLFTHKTLAFAHKMFAF